MNTMFCTFVILFIYDIKILTSIILLSAILRNPEYDRE